MRFPVSGKGFNFLTSDYLEVYALDGIRAMIEKKMAELDLRDGYPIIPDPTVLKGQSNGKGKARAEVSASSTARASSPARTTFPTSSGSQPYHFPTTSPPPDYVVNAPVPSPIRRRPPPLTSASMGNYGQYPLPSPVRATTRISAGAGHLVRTIPTNPRSTNTSSVRTMSTGTRNSSVPLASPRTLRGQK